MSSHRPDWRKPYTPEKCSYPGCEYVPGTRTHQIRHMETVHEKKKTFPCPSIKCHFRSCHKQAVTEHYNMVHLKIKRLQCHVCPYRTDKKNALRYHMNTHLKSGHNMKKCDHCRVHLSFTPGRGRVGKDPDALRKRQCHLCTTLCPTKNRLLRHMPAHVNDGHNLESCDYCIRNFADAPHPYAACRPAVAAATPVRRKRKRNRSNEYSSRIEEENDPSSSGSKSSDDDGDENVDVIRNSATQSLNDDLVDMHINMQLLSFA